MTSINHDGNAVNNMIKKDQKNIRHYKFPEIIKDDNPNIVSVKYYHV